MVSIRRTFRRLLDNRDQYLAYARPRASKWVKDPFGDRPESIDMEQVVLVSNHLGSHAQAAPSVFVTESQLRVIGLEPAYLDYVKRRLEEDIAQRLVAANRYVNQDEPIQWMFTVDVHCSARVKTWPDVPGITSPPWETCGFDQRLPFDADWDLANRVIIPSMYGAEHDEYSRGAYRLAWMAEPLTAALARRMPLPEYFTIIEDDRIERGILRLVKEVS